MTTTPTTQAGRALIVSITDHLVHGEDDAGAGALVTELLQEAGFVVDGSVLVPSEAVDIRTALNTGVIGGVDLIVTVGGVGVAPRDVTPDVTAEVIDRQLPGIAQALRWSGMAAGVTDAVVSRGLVGVSGQTLIANIAELPPGDPRRHGHADSAGRPRHPRAVRPGGLAHDGRVRRSGGVRIGGSVRDQLSSSSPLAALIEFSFALAVASSSSSVSSRPVAS